MAPRYDDDDDGVNDYSSDDYDDIGYNTKESEANRSSDTRNRVNNHKDTRYTSSAVPKKQTMPPSQKKPITSTAATIYSLVAPTKGALPQRQVRLSSRALREIRHYQTTTHLLIPKRPFSRLLRDIVQGLVDTTTSSTPYRFQESALLALQESTEAYCVHLLEDSYLCTEHARRKTLMARDMRLARRLRGDRENFTKNF